MAGKSPDDPGLLVTALRSAQRILKARQRAEEELRDQSEWLRVTLASIADAVITADAHGRVSFMNAVAETLTGRRATESLNLPLAEVLTAVDEHTRLPLERAAARTLGGDPPAPFSATLTPAGKDGPGDPDLTVEGSVAPIRAEGGSVVGCVLVFRDVTARRAADYRDRFLVRLDDTLRPLVDPGEITLTAARSVGEHLGVQRCAYADVEADQDTFNLTGDYTRGVASIVGRYTFSQFGAECLRLMRSGQPFVVEDAEQDPRCADTLAAYRSTEIRSVICVPLHKAGRFVAAMAVHASSPRRWRAEEIEVLRAVASRCWESIERSRVTRVLRQSEERFRRLTESIPQLVWTAGRDGRWDYLSRQWVVYTGLPEHRLVGEGWLDCVHADDREALLAEWQRCVRSLAPFSTAFRLCRHDGEYRWFQASALAAEDGPGARWFGTNTDITERKLAEQEMALLKAALESANDSVVITEAALDDPGPRIEYVNPAFTTLTGYRADEVVGKTPRILQGPLTDRALMARLRRDLQARRQFEGETVNYRKDGSTYFVEWRITPLRASDGSVLKWVAIQRDVTDRKRTEEELARHRDHLQRLVDERTAELEASHRQLRMSERMAALGTLSAGLGHDMGNLLVPIRVRLESLAKADLPEPLRQDVEAIRTSTEYLRKLSAGLRQLAVDPAQASMPESTDVRSWWEEAEPMLRNSLPRGIGLRSRMPEARLRVRMSRPALTQAVFNLVQNAGDAMRERGQGTVTVWADVTGAGPDRGGAVRIGVADDGPGMTPEVRARCMEPFFTTKTRGMSTGMGLALVYGLIRDAGGAVTLDSEPGRGTAFVLLLPEGGSHDAVGPGPDAPTAAVEVRDPRMKALIVSELRSLAFDIRARAECPSPDLLVIDRNAAPPKIINGTRIVLLDQSSPDATGRTVSIGERPTPQVIRETLVRIAGLERPTR